MIETTYSIIESKFDTSDFMKRRNNLAFFTVPAESLRPLLMHLRDKLGFTHLVLLTAVDWIEQNQFQLTYLLCNRLENQELGVKVMIDREMASMEAIHDIWPTASVYQRELREMFGINFPGSPRIDEEFILEGWNDIPPYRRDFDTLKYAQESYAERPGRETRDPEQYMKEKLYPGQK